MPLRLGRIATTDSGADNNNSTRRMQGDDAFDHRCANDASRLGGLTERVRHQCFRRAVPLARYHGLLWPPKTQRPNLTRTWIQLLAVLVAERLMKVPEEVHEVVDLFQATVIGAAGPPGWCEPWERRHVRAGRGGQQGGQVRCLLRQHIPRGSHGDWSWEGRLLQTDRRRLANTSLISCNKPGGVEHKVAYHVYATPESACRIRSKTTTPASPNTEPTRMPGNLSLKN